MALSDFDNTETSEDGKFFTILDEVIFELEEDGIRMYEIGEKVGHGSFATVFKIIGKNKVIRFESDSPKNKQYKENFSSSISLKEKYELMKKLQGKKLKNVVYTPLVKYISWAKMLVSVMEELYPIEDDFTKDVDLRAVVTVMLIKMTEVYRQAKGIKDDLASILSNIILRTGMSKYDQEIAKELVKVDKYIKFFKDVLNGIKELDALGIEATDLHLGNIHKNKKGDYKLIDFII